MINYENFAFVTIITDSYFEQGKKLVFSLAKNNTWLKHIKVICSDKLAPLSKDNIEELKDISPAVEILNVDETPYERYISTGKATPSVFKLETFNLKDVDTVAYVDADSICVKDMMNMFLTTHNFSTIKEDKKLNLKTFSAIKLKKNVLGFHFFSVPKKNLSTKMYNKLIGFMNTYNCPHAENVSLNEYFNSSYINFISDIFFANSGYFKYGKNMNLKFKMVHYSGYKPWLNKDEDFSGIEMYYTGVKEPAKRIVKREPIKVKPISLKPEPAKATNNNISDSTLESFEKEYLAFIEQLKANKQAENNEETF